VIIHWLGDMFDPALKKLLGNLSLDTAMDIASASSTPTPAKSTVSKSRCSTSSARSTCAGRLDSNVKNVYRRRFQLSELIAGDEQGISHALLGIFDAIAPARLLRAVAPFSRDEGRFPRRAPADGAAVAPYLQGAARFYKTGNRVHGLPQRPPGSFHHGGRAGEHALDLGNLAELFRLADQAGLLANPERQRGG
jgi:hypothetical protein